MYKAIDIAVYVINYINRHECSVSNLKLQKILYYIQAAFLCDKNKECFSDTILCWRHGPVVPTVYDVFNKYGSDNIPTQNSVSKIIVQNGKLKFVKKPFNENIIILEDRNFMTDVIESLMCYTAWYLVERTHEEDPWKNLEYYNEEITSQSILKYFKNHRGRIYGEFNN